MQTGTLSITAEPKLSRFENAQSCEFRIFKNHELCPASKRFIHCTRFIEACLYDDRGDLIPASERPAGGGLNGDLVLNVNLPVLPFPGRPERRIAGRSIYLGHWMLQYGHFLIETLSRCWSLAEDNAYDNYVFYPFVFNGGAAEIIHFQRFFLERLGIPVEKIVFLDAAASFERVDLPEQQWPLSGPANALLSSFYARLAHSEKRAIGNRKLFLSRKPAGFQRLFNISEVEEVFLGAEFEILYPESLAISEQITAYREAAIIAGFSGSAMHNCIFAPRGCTLIEIGDVRSPERFLLPQRVANELSGMRAHRIPYFESRPGCIATDIIEKNLYRMIGKSQVQVRGVGEPMREPTAPALKPLHEQDGPD
jgi:hypothetical protein